MPGDNTIALLSNICKKLDIISQNMVSANKPGAQAEAVQKDIINNKTTGLNTTASTPQATVKPIQPSVINTVIKTEAEKGAKAEKSPIDKNISIKDITAFLKDLPTAVLAVTKMGGGTIKKFENVLGKLSNSIANFAEKVTKTKFSNSDAKKYKIIIDSISTLSASVKKIALMAPIVPIFDLSLLLMIPGIKLLTKIFDMFSKVKDTKKAMAGIKAMNDMMKGMGIVVAASIAMAIAIKVLGMGEILKGIGLVLGIVTALSVLALVIGAVAAHMKIADVGLVQITKFIASMLAITAATMILGLVIGKGMPLLLAGLGGVLAVMIAYSGITIAVAFVGSLIGGVEKFGILNQIVKFVAWNLAITAATMILGAVIAQAWPLLAYGFAGVSAVMIGYGLITIGMMALAAKLKVLEKTKALLDIVKFEAACLGIAFGTILLGWFLKNHVAETALGFVLMAGVITGTIGIAMLAQRVTKGRTVEKAAKAMMEISKFMLLCGGVAAEIILIGEGIKLVGSGKVWEAFGLFTGIVLEGAGLALLVNSINKAANFKKAATSMLLISAFMAICGAVAGEIVLVGAGIKEVGSDKVWEAFGMFTAIVVEGAALAILANSMKSQFQKGAMAMLPISALLAASAAVLMGIIGILIIKKNNEIEWSDTFIAIGAMATLVAAFGALCGVAGMFSAVIMAGALPLLAAQGVAAASALVLLGIIEVLRVKNEAGIEWGDTFAAVGAMATLVAAFGALAGVAGIFAPVIIAGSLALMAAQGLAAVSLIVLTGVVGFTVYAIENLGDDWGSKATNSVKMMEKIVTEFGALATVAGLVFPFMALGALGLAAVTGIASSTIDLLNRIVSLRIKMDEAGLNDESIQGMIGTMKRACQGFIDMIKGVSFGGFMGSGIVQVMAKGSALSKMMTQVAIIANALGSVAAISTEDGQIRPAKFIGDKLVTGEPVDILASAKTITATVREFTKLIGEDFRNISLKDMVHAMIAIKAMNQMLDPISNFVTALMGFETSGDGTLHTVKITDDGKVINGHDVHLVDVANIIAGAVSTFAATLFSPENANLWEQFKYGEDADGNYTVKSGLEVGMGVLANVIDPVTKFVDCLSQFEAGTGEELTMPVYDNEGNIKSVRKINVVNIANTIANAVTTFATTLASHADEWEAAFNKGAHTEKRITSEGWFTDEYEYVEVESDMARAMGVFSKVVTPVVSFVNCMSKFTATPNGISILDNKGVEHKTDLKLLATKIAEAVTNFITSMSSLGTSAEMTTTSEIVGNILKSTTKPVIDFATSLIPYADSQPGWLPILAEDGTKERDVNILGASENILNCVKAYTSSINELKSGIVDNASAISTGADSVSKYIKALLDKSDDKQIKKIDKLGASVSKTANSFSKLDNVLSKGNQKRIKNINDLTTAVEKLATQVQSDSIKKLSELFIALSNVNSNNVEKVAEAISRMDLGGGSSGGGGGTSKTTIIKAIQEALDEMEISGGSATVTYKTSNNRQQIDTISMPAIQINMNNNQ